MPLSCTICHDFFDATVSFVATKCGHIFHIGCIDRWLELSDSCPECRGYIPENSLTKLFFRDMPGKNIDESLNSLREQLRAKNLESEEKDKAIFELCDSYENYKKDLENFFGRQENLLRNLTTNLETLVSVRMRNAQLLENNNNLQHDLKHLKNVHEVVEGGFNDTLTILSDMLVQVSREEDKSPTRKLAANCCAIKQELIESKEEKTQLQNELSELKCKLERLQAEGKEKKSRRKFHDFAGNLSEIASMRPSSISITPGVSNNLSTQSNDLAGSTLTCCPSDENQVSQVRYWLRARAVKSSRKCQDETN